MKTSKKVLIAAGLTAIVILTVLGIIQIFAWLGSISKVLQGAVFGVLCIALAFWVFYNKVSEMERKENPDDDDDDDDEEWDYGRGVNLGEIDLGEIDPHKHESDYEPIKEEKDLQPFEKRLFEESSQLDTRILALEAFVKTEKFKSLDLRQAAVLVTQMKAMQLYFAILSNRMILLGLIKAKKDATPANDCR